MPAPTTTLPRDPVSHAATLECTFVTANDNTGPLPGDHRTQLSSYSPTLVPMTKLSLEALPTPIHSASHSEASTPRQAFIPGCQMWGNLSSQFCPSGTSSVFSSPLCTADDASPVPCEDGNPLAPRDPRVGYRKVRTPVRTNVPMVWDRSATDVGSPTLSTASSTALPFHAGPWRRPFLDVLLGLPRNESKADSVIASSDGILLDLSHSPHVHALKHGALTSPDGIVLDLSIPHHRGFKASHEVQTAAIKRNDDWISAGLMLHC